LCLAAWRWGWCKLRAGEMAELCSRRRFALVTSLHCSWAARHRSHVGSSFADCIHRAAPAPSLRQHVSRLAWRNLLTSDFRKAGSVIISGCPRSYWREQTVLLAHRWRRNRWELL